MLVPSPPLRWEGWGLVLKEKEVVCLCFSGLQTGVGEDRHQMGTLAKKKKKKNRDGREVPGTHVGHPVGKGLLMVCFCFSFLRVYSPLQQNC